MQEGRNVIKLGAPRLGSRFNDHILEAEALAVQDLGPRPADLVNVLVDIALGSPAVCAMRALSHVADADIGLDDFDVRNNASSIAWAMRSLFNRPELMALVRASSDDQSYWRDVLAHAVNGGLQSVLDEYAHVLNEGLGVAERPVSMRLERIAQEIDAALSTRTAVSRVDELQVSRGELAINSERMRSHFAVRFGRGVSEDDATMHREGQVRTSYNSPFWPFVLASTSVGQEGLDFHQYSHAIAHWNLPGNPVDLEQREGRVHRYKNHAVRKNIARMYGGRPEVLDAADPWAAMFELAAADRPDGETMIWPHWIFPLPDGAHIERYVPALPLSKEAHAYRRLMRTVGAYRLVFGQPRQEDLLRYLGDRVDGLESLRIDLAP